MIGEQSEAFFENLANTLAQTIGAYVADGIRDGFQTHRDEEMNVVIFSTWIPAQAFSAATSVNPAGVYRVEGSEGKRIAVVRSRILALEGESEPGDEMTEGEDGRNHFALVQNVNTRIRVDGAAEGEADDFGPACYLVRGSVEDVSRVLGFDTTVKLV